MAEKEQDVFALMRASDSPIVVNTVFEPDEEFQNKVIAQRTMLRSINLERPSPSRSQKIGVYIRYFNQTRYEDYLEKHIKQFKDTIALCPLWELVDFYIDKGASAPKMGTAPEWNRLMDDAMAHKVDLIITQKVSNVSTRPFEMSICSQILAAQKPPIGIYFISEDLFTLATYCISDLHDPYFFPASDWKLLPDDEEESEESRHD